MILSELFEGVKTIRHDEKDEPYLMSSLKASYNMAKRGYKDAHLEPLMTVNGFVIVGNRIPQHVNNYFILKDDVAVGMLYTKCYPPISETKTHQAVGLSYIVPEYRRTGIGLYLYKAAIDTGVTLYTDDHQTLAAQFLWQKLVTMPGYETGEEDGRVFVKLASKVG